MPAHLFLCAIRSLVLDEQVDPGSVVRASWAVRRAFFQELVDISDQSSLLAIAEALDLPRDKIQDRIHKGDAHSILADDLTTAREQSIQVSPTLVFNEGRQKLAGNVGYRIIEANIRELRTHPPDEYSWC